ncbi:MAG: tetratricopeptide repeat protein [Gammaproteobacteria bacterium]|nr:tetratricopeptide repeat protein [Gammaproteobacteria bacterium]
MSARLLPAIIALLMMSGCATRAPLPASPSDVAVDPVVDPIEAVAAASSVLSPSEPTAIDLERIALLRRNARSAENQRDWQTALTCHAQIVAELPGDLEALIGLAENYRRLQRRLEAELTWHAAQAIDARDDRVVHGYVAFLISAGRAQEALEVIAPMVMAAGLAGTAELGERTYALAGAAYDRLGDHAAAERVYRRGLRGHPDSVSLRNNLAFGLILQGRPHYAAVLLMDMEKAGLGGSRQRQNLALAWALAGRTDRASEVAGRDQDVATLQTNLNYFAWLRGLDREPRRLALLGL